jgi:hypothetical protein
MIPYLTHLSLTDLPLTELSLTDQSLTDLPLAELSLTDLSLVDLSFGDLERWLATILIETGKLQVRAGFLIAYSFSCLKKWGMVRKSGTVIPEVFEIDNLNFPAGA